MDSETFLYFAYASNLLKERLQLENPSATFVAIGKLENYRFCFDTNGDPTACEMKGAMANIEPQPGAEVWGVVWRLDKDDMDSLNRQEHEHQPLTVKVISQDQGFECHCFKMIPQTVKTTWDKRPSPQYKEIILLGARQSDLPTEYTHELEKWDDNNYQGQVDVYDRVMKIMQN
ncbi:gamma-glutamylcyclotransferase-like [Mizuhopecten yessoensis]|uniref:gamma-glutamylcyclotransferase n=1 Tax=Mizuhopecten yessoensis TaxID=6573 RepID=A0A210PN65_MIZYE|nr:gamma-glutamylcyclotransferase-like [Mizuhopecten yessoensis]OWF37950.1 Gamma-glutamylcyclotransferase [Mizuhopecten yessoensis]